MSSLRSVESLLLALYEDPLDDDLRLITCDALQDVGSPHESYLRRGWHQETRFFELSNVACVERGEDFVFLHLKQPFVTVSLFFRNDSNEDAKLQVSMVCNLAQLESMYPFHTLNPSCTLSHNFVSEQNRSLMRISFIGACLYFNILTEYQNATGVLVHRYTQRRNWLREAFPRILK